MKVEDTLPHPPLTEQEFEIRRLVVSLHHNDTPEYMMIAKLPYREYLDIRTKLKKTYYICTNEHTHNVTVYGSGRYIMDPTTGVIEMDEIDHEEVRCTVCKKESWQDIWWVGSMEDFETWEELSGQPKKNK